MANFRIWLNAARPRTLPLSLSGIITGSALALKTGFFQLDIFIPALLTTLFLQVLSNFANDYGDASKGADNEERIGPQRMVQSGMLSHREIKRGIFIMAILAFSSGILLLINAFGWSKAKYFTLFLVLGLVAIWAAMQYTMGKRAYGYRGLGDLFVMIFFGFVSVSGSYFLYSREIIVDSLLQSIVIGSLATGVLHLNNMRDRTQDMASGKNTLAVMLGIERSKDYFLILVLLAVISLLVSIANIALHYTDYLPVLAIVPLFLILSNVRKVKDAIQYNSFLKPLALSTFFYSVLLFISWSL